MKLLESSSFRGRTFVILIVCLGIPLLATFSVVQYLNKDIFYEQKGDNLTCIASVLNNRLDERGYDAILKDYGAQDATREEKIAALNDALSDVTDEVASVAEGLGVGYYSRELDAILTYGPSSVFSDNVGKSIAPDHPGRKVMAANAPMVQMGTMVRGNIMNAMVPVERNGEVIGYIWANELVSELENMLNRSTALISTLLLLTYLLMVAIVTIFFRQLMRTEKKSRDTVEEAAKEIKRVDDLMHIVNKAVSSLLSADESSFEEAQQNCMTMMMTALEVDRLSIWRRDKAEPGGVFRLEASCQNELGNSCDHIDFGLNDFPEAAEWPEWLCGMEDNRIVSHFLSQMTEEKKQWLASFGICSITTVPVFLQDDFWGFVSFTNCHTERGFSQDEEAILVSGSMLMSNAIARNEMLHRLVLAREDALAGTRAKSAFLASMSHEMRTPMNAIIGMATIGRSATDEARKNYAFGKISDASIHLLGIINDVLDISKIESGKLELSPSEFVFEEMLQRVVNVTGGPFAEKEQSFLVRIDDAIPATLICDDQRFAQVITNLLSNAVKFTPQHGAIRLDARLLSEEKGICTIQIDVSDTGIGLNEEQQMRVFKSFEQAEGSTTRKYGGTGLGLSISKNLVELMGGEIWVKSEEGKGATFSFTVRAAVGSRRNIRALPDGPEWGNFSLLLVCGNAKVLEYFSGMMEKLGLESESASSGEEAVALMHERGGYDLFFVDWRIGDIDGVELARQIKDWDTDQKVVLLATPAEWDKLLANGKIVSADKILSKPILPSAITACIAECLAPERQAEQDDTLEGGSGDDYSGRIILLAEDVEVNREILLALLEDTGVTIDCAENGAEAVSMFRENPGRYEMVFMDVQMPEMDGYEATRVIRAMEVSGAKEIPIVAMTANVFREDVEACRQAGMNDHVGKPLNLEEVLDKLRRYLA